MPACSRRPQEAPSKITATRSKPVALPTSPMRPPSVALPTLPVRPSPVALPTLPTRPRLPNPNRDRKGAALTPAFNPILKNALFLSQQFLKLRQLAKRREVRLFLQLLLLLEALFERLPEILD